eukprot:5490256-Pyramimonas_sp.AAC.1
MLFKATTSDNLLVIRDPGLDVPVQGPPSELVSRAIVGCEFPRGTNLAEQSAKRCSFVSAWDRSSKTE